MPPGGMAKNKKKVNEMTKKTITTNQENITPAGATPSTEQKYKKVDLLTSILSTNDYEEERLDFGPDGYFPVTNGVCLNDRYKLLSLLGSGSFATVHKAEDLEDKSTVAVKIGRSGEMDNDICKKEIKTLQLVSGGSENIVQFIDHFSVSGPHGKHSVMVFELLGSDLWTILNSTRKPLSLDTVRKYSKDILNALDYIHSKCGLVHCDLKPENLMISETGALKLGDFGFTVLNPKECTFNVGTCHYRPPEVFLNSKISFPTDLWSFGCTLFEMVIRFNLFGCEMEGCNLVKHMKQIAGATGEIIYQQFYERTTQNQEKFEMVFGDRTTFVSNPNTWLSPEQLRKWRRMTEEEAKVISDFLKKLLRSDPKKRITAKEAMEHPFLIDC